MGPKKNNSKHSAPKPALRAGSVEEVEHLLGLQITLQKAANDQPNTPTLRQQAKSNMVVLQKSLQTWGEKIEMIDDRRADATTLSDQQELAVKKTYRAIIEQIEAIKGGDDFESLKLKPQTKELEKQMDELSKMCIDTEEDFATKRPLWKP